jgi:hypothetical protein
LTGTATASRLRLLKRCPGRADCYIYVVRAGDNLSGLSTFFGVSLDRILAMNPSIGTGRLIFTGSQLLIPTPTR